MVIRTGKTARRPASGLKICGRISPKIDMQFIDLGKWYNKQPTSHQFDFFVLTSSCGNIDQKEARQKTHRRENTGFLFLRNLNICI